MNDVHGFSLAIVGLFVKSAGFLAFPDKYYIVRNHLCLSMKFAPGALLRTGGEHHVAELDSATLIKWPRKDPVLGVQSYEAIVTQLRLISELGVRIPETTVCGPSQIVLDSTVFEVPYCVLSEKKEGSRVALRDFKRADVRSDLAVMLEASQYLEASVGFSLDMFGTLVGFRAFSPDQVLSKNLLVCDEGLVLVDCTLRNLNNPQSIQQFVRMRLMTLAQNVFGASII